ncbi:hypothetical protein [Micropruina sp.]|uniref:hypothetical protein n=1 Tax=Micropruina sp. TaxID=2737536 RepID=UPI0039E24C94
MDLSAWVMIIVLTWTVLGLLLVAAIWSRAPWKAVLAWLGIALVPLGIWLVGLWQPAIDGWNTLALWWQSLVFTLPVLLGLGVLGFAALLLLGSRLVPTRPRKRKPTTTIPPATMPPAYRQPPTSGTPAEQTLILPENRQGLS